MARWREATLGDVCDEVDGLIQTGPFGSQLHQSDYSELGTPVVMPKDIIEGRIAPDSIARISTEHVDRLSRHKLLNGDIVYGRRGDIGRQALITSAEAGWLCGTGCLRISLGDSVLLPQFLHYYLRQEDVVSWITNQAVGATMPNLNTGILRSVPVRFPSLPTQRRIAGILSAYDELIENSQRRIKILESMARALYREWFVHFRFPGHDNPAGQPDWTAEGRPAGASATDGASQSVPRVSSPLGEIPKGWEVKKLGEIADISWGDTSTTKAAYVEDGYAAYSASGLDGKLDHYDFDRLGIVLSAIGAQCGKTWLARGKWSCIKNTIRFWSKSECVSTEFLFIATLGQDFWPRRGAAQPFISQGDAERIDVLVPDIATMKRFNIFASASLQHIATLDSQIQNLRRTRDLLLPRLLSGQIDVEAIP